MKDRDSLCYAAVNIWRTDKGTALSYFEQALKQEYIINSLGQMLRYILTLVWLILH